MLADNAIPTAAFVDSAMTKDFDKLKVSAQAAVADPNYMTLSDEERQMEPLLRDNANRFVILPIEYPQVWEMYKRPKRPSGPSRKPTCPRTWTTGKASRRANSTLSSTSWPSSPPATASSTRTSSTASCPRSP